MRKIVFLCLCDTRKKLNKIWVNLLFIDLNEEMCKMLRDVSSDVKDTKFLFFKYFFFSGGPEMLRWSEISPEAFFLEERKQCTDCIIIIKLKIRISQLLHIHCILLSWAVFFYCIEHGYGFQRLELKSPSET